MKKVFVALLIFAAVFFIAPQALAATGQIVPMTRWQCLLCDKQFFTFEPDYIDGEVRENNDVDYQQRNWLMLGTKSPIPKCAKFEDGAHIFDSKGNFKASTLEVANNKDRIIVLRERGQDLRIRAVEWECGVCNSSGRCFEGDPLGVFADNLTPKNLLGFADMKDKRKVGSCSGGRIKLPDGANLMSHVLFIKNRIPHKSINIADMLRDYYFSF